MTNFLLISGPLNQFLIQCLYRIFWQVTQDYNSCTTWMHQKFEDKLTLSTQCEVVIYEWSLGRRLKPGSLGLESSVGIKGSLAESFSDAAITINGSSSPFCCLGCASDSVWPLTETRHT